MSRKVSHSWHSFEHCNSWPFDCFWCRDWTIFTILFSSKRFEWHTLSTKQQLCYDICYHWMDFCQNIDGFQWPKEGKLDPVLILFLNVWQYVHFPTLEGDSSQTWRLSRPIYFFWGPLTSLSIPFCSIFLQTCLLGKIASISIHKSSCPPHVACQISNFLKIPGTYMPYCGKTEDEWLGAELKPST